MAYIEIRNQLGGRKSYYVRWNEGGKRKSVYASHEHRIAIEVRKKIEHDILVAKLGRPK